MRFSFSTFFPTHPIADANPTNTAASVIVFTILLCSAIFRGNVKTLSLPKCNLAIHLLSFWRCEWASKGVIYVFAMFKAKWTHDVFPPCTKRMWFKLSFYKVFPILIYVRFHHYMMIWSIHSIYLFFFRFFLTFFMVSPNVKSAYLFTITTYFYLSTRFNIIHFRWVFGRQKYLFFFPL